MELVPGISAHFVQSKKFKTNKITIRFTAPLSLETIAGRMLSASMLETANQVYHNLKYFADTWQVYMEQIFPQVLIVGDRHIFLTLTFTYVEG